MKYVAASLLFFLGVGIFPFDLRVIQTPAGLFFFSMSFLLIFFSYRMAIHGGGKISKNKILSKNDFANIESFTAGLNKYFNAESFADFLEIDDSSLCVAIGIKRGADRLIIATIFVHRETVGLNSCSIRTHDGNRLPGKEYYSTVQETLFENRRYFANMVSSMNKVASVSPRDEEAIYERAANEIETNLRKKGLWAKSLAEADGNEVVAKARYIRVRSQQLLHEHQQQI